MFTVIFTFISRTIHQASARRFQLGVRFAVANPGANDPRALQQQGAATVLRKSRRGVGTRRYFGLLLGFALATPAAVPSAFAADRALSVTEKVDLRVAPARAWETIKDFDGWQQWHPAIGGTDILKGKDNTKGTVRVLTTKDGAKITEELLSHDSRSMTYQYKFLESPLPVENYVSTIKIVKTKDGSAVVWSSNFTAKQGTADDDAKKAIAGIYVLGLENLKRMLDPTPVGYRNY